MKIFKEKPFLIVVVFLIVVLSLGGFYIIKNNSSGNTEEEATPTPVLPPADPNIVVVLKPMPLTHEVELSISNFPSDVESIEYELIYKTPQKNEGLTGTIKISGEKSVTRTITIGTCSSGKCVYHNPIDGKGTLTLKFNAKSGASRFQKDFQLQ